MQYEKQSTKATGLSMMVTCGFNQSVVRIREIAQYQACRATIHQVCLLVQKLLLAEAAVSTALPGATDGEFI